MLTLAQMQEEALRIEKLKSGMGQRGRSGALMAEGGSQ